MSTLATYGFIKQKKHLGWNAIIINKEKTHFDLCGRKKGVNMFLSHGWTVVILPCHLAWAVVIHPCHLAWAVVILPCHLAWDVVTHPCHLTWAVGILPGHLA